MANPNLEITLPSGQKQQISGTDPNYDIYVKQGAKPVAESTPVAPVSPTTPTTPNSSLPTRYPSAEESYYKGQYEKAQTFDPEAIKKEERARIQAQIDSINKYFTDVTMPQVQQEQAQNIGASRAIQSGAGLMETPMGQAQTTKTQEYNRRIMRSEEAARDEKINALYANADAAAQERITAERTLARQDTQAYFDFLKGQKADAVQNIKDLAAGGVSIDDVKKDSARYQTLLDATGMDDLTATALFNANAPKTAAKDITYKTVGDKIIGYYYNDSTGKIETVESDSIPGLAGGQYKPQVMADGTLLMIPESIDPTKSIDEQIIQYGGKGQWSKGKTRIISPTTTPTPEISSYQAERATRTIQSVDELTKLAEATPGIFGRTAALPIPDYLRSDEYRNFKTQLDTLISNITYGELTAMREASKTGGALGQVSDREGQLLGASLGALSMTQSPKSFKEQLQKVKSSIERWQQAAGGESTTNSDPLGLGI